MSQRKTSGVLFFMASRKAIRRQALSIALGALTLATACGSSAPPEPPPFPSVGVWYRGEPGGKPALDDLAVMRALDFSSVTWPASNSNQLGVITRLADTLHLAVVTRKAPEPLRFASALNPGAFVDISIAATPPEAIVSLAWRAVAHGARVISFDPGNASGSGLANVDGEMPAWIPAAKSVARQVSRNAAFIASLQDGPAVTIDAPTPRDLDVVLREVEHSWLIVATNGSDSAADAVVHLPAAVPYALWISMLDGSNLSMLAAADGPHWHVQLPPHGAAVYIIDKNLK